MKKISLCAILLLIRISSSYAQTWQWAKSSVGIDLDHCSSVISDASGNAFLTGGFHSPTITFGSTTLTNAGGATIHGDPYNDVFIAKYDVNGNMLWAKSAGGTSYDAGLSVSVDAGGNVIVTGAFHGQTITFGSTTLTNIDSSGNTDDIFIVKYDTNGNVLWAKSAGGSGNDCCYSVCADVSGNIFATGIFGSPTIPFDTTTLANAGGFDVFISKYDASGNVLWAKSAGGPNHDEGYSVSADASGNVFLTGFFFSPSIIFGSNTLSNVSTSLDMFIVKYDSNGNVLWAKSEGGTASDYAYSISADPSGNVFVTGWGYSPSITFGSTTLTNTGVQNEFIVKYDANGNVLWAKSAGGTNSSAVSVSADISGNAFVTGAFNLSIIFDSDTLTPPSGSVVGTFIVKYDANGNVLCASAIAVNNCYSICADQFGNAYIGGSYDINPFIIGIDTLSPTGQRNVFVAKFSCNNIVAVNEINNEEINSVFPNPSAGSFTVNFKNTTIATQICVYDLVGNCILNKSCRNETSLKIDLSSQAKGIYFLEIVSEGEKVVNKIVLQ